MGEPTQGIIIGIEAAISGGSLSLYREGKAVDGYVGEKGVSRAEDLLPNIDQLLRRNDSSRDKVVKLVVSTGPGSFTGIKIGIATAMGLADGLGCTLVGVSALAALSLADEKDGDILTAVPVGRNLVCGQHFDRSAARSEPTSNAELFSEGQFSNLFASMNGSAILYEQLYDRLPKVKPHLIFNGGSNIATLLVRGDLKGLSSSDVAPIFIDRKLPAVAG